MYLTYEEYASMGGTIEESLFDDYEFGAEALVNYYTFNRLVGDTDIPISVKRLIKYLIGLAQKKASAMSLGDNASDESVVGPYITSQSNDGVSVTYGGAAATDLYKMCGNEAKEAIHVYLNGVMNEAGRYLLYRGLYPGE